MAHLDDDHLRALSARPNEPLELNQAHMSYYVLSSDAFHYVEPFLIDRKIREEELRRELQVAFDEEARGAVEPWEIESVLQDGRDNLQRRSPSR
jgi:hypothetical protein